MLHGRYGGGAREAARSAIAGRLRPVAAVTAACAPQRRAPRRGRQLRPTSTSATRRSCERALHRRCAPQIAWLLPWFGGIWLLSWLGSIGGGRNVIGFGWDILLVSVWSVVVMLLAVRCALGPTETAVMMQRMDRTS